MCSSWLVHYPQDRQRDKMGWKATIPCRRIPITVTGSLIFPSRLCTTRSNIHRVETRVRALVRVCLGKTHAMGTITAMTTCSQGLCNQKASRWHNTRDGHSNMSVVWAVTDILKLLSSSYCTGSVSVAYSLSYALLQYHNACWSYTSSIKACFSAGIGVGSPLRWVVGCTAPYTFRMCIALQFTFLLT